MGGVRISDMPRSTILIPPVGTVTSNGIDFMRHISGRVHAELPILEDDPAVTADFAALQISF